LCPGREPILVIEPDADFGRALVEQLAADGHPAELARTRLAEGHPRPVGDRPQAGQQALERQTASPWPRDLPVIVPSSRTTEPDMLRTFEAGADDFLARPARYLELRELAIQSLIDREPPALLLPVLTDPRARRR